MSGTIIGGKKAAKTNVNLHGEDFYSRIGKIGGSKGKTGGYASEKIGTDGLTGKQRAQKSGRAGGGASKRGYKLISKGIFSNTYIKLSTGERVKVRH